VPLDNNNLRSCLVALLAATGMVCSCMACNTTTRASDVTQQQQETVVTQHVIRRPLPVLDPAHADSVPSLPDAEDELFAPHTLIIHYDSEVGKQPLMQAVQDYGAELIYDYNSFPAIAIRVPDSVDIHDAIRHFELVQGVLQVSRDRKVQLMRQHGLQR